MRSWRAGGEGGLQRSGGQGQGVWGGPYRVPGEVRVCGGSQRSGGLGVCGGPYRVPGEVKVCGGVQRSGAGGQLCVGGRTAYQVRSGGVGVCRGRVAKLCGGAVPRTR